MRGFRSVACEPKSCRRLGSDVELDESLIIVRRVRGRSVSDHSHVANPGGGPIQSESYCLTIGGGPRRRDDVDPIGNGHIVGLVQLDLLNPTLALHAPEVQFVVGIARLRIRVPSRYQHRSGRQQKRTGVIVAGMNPRLLCLPLVGPGEGLGDEVDTRVVDLGL